MNPSPLLQINNLCISFRSIHTQDVLRAVNNVSFEVYPGEIFGLAGESGSGKTTLAKAILRLQSTDSGSILYKGNQINRRLSHHEKFDYIRQVQMVFQDPVASINDRAKVYDILNEGLNNISKRMPEKDHRAKIETILTEVGLVPDDMNRFAYTFSGGQLQRIGIARALLMKPELIVADEPVSALDLSVRGQILNLMNALKKKHHLTFVFISHDLSLMRYFCNRIAIMCSGKIVELGASEQIFNHPIHAYTQSLLSAIPIPNPNVERQRAVFTCTEDIRDKMGNELVEIEAGHFVVTS